MKKSTPENKMEWLQTMPTLDELCRAYPEVWDIVQREIAGIVAGGGVAELQAYLKRSTLESGMIAKKLQKSRGDKKILETTLLQLVRNRMTHLAIRQHCVSEATGIEKGKVRFNLFNGYIAQKLLFNDGLERKPVSLFLFRLIWSLLPQRRLLMPLVQPEGIYCFYSRQLVDQLVGLIAARNCLEIASGDGTLTRFLTGRGVKITATDDYSWKYAVKYPEFVVKRDAGDALREYAPEVVLCSWPPAGNTFEQQVFRTKSVHLYIVIASRHRFATGNWDEYMLQSAFSFEEEKQLSRMVLPPELDPAVYIFRRKPASL
ncbi:MAG: hypothetical protein PHD54_13710 [Desulfuromonadaceae bacterium]|nr:hypothetical protein [Desulfuromonadaceae bacterium]